MAVGVRSRLVGFKGDLAQRLYHARLKRLGVDVGPGVYIGRRSLIPSSVKIGHHSRIRQAKIGTGRLVQIGAYCDIGEAVRILPLNHSMDHANLQVRLQRQLGLGDLEDDRGPIVIGNNVWIGDRVTILSGARIGNGAIIGAGAVVTGDVEPFTIVGGLPAKPIRKRFSDDVIEALEALAWWDWSEEEMLSRSDLFAWDLTANDAAERLRDLLDRNGTQERGAALQSG